MTTTCTRTATDRSRRTPLSETGDRQAYVTETQQIRVRASISGTVQGVGFRYFTVTEAKRLGMTGWVRNRMDGTVETEAQGTGPDVGRFVARLHVGPRWSMVEHVAVDHIPVVSGERSFTVRRDRE
ncbi:acylphosphatase [Bifidobacterium catulorum]|uniref:Acylphosphatase n=1 Tax=Bifidobacterium catulorum TaxID=1630173 RepID=A0A2U2MUZ7_9BIFI|nr:acylphosphatase [Bifidobacterium catulorum]